MGNNPSSSANKEAAGKQRSTQHPPVARRRDSTHHAPVPAAAKATPAPPSASLESAVAQPALSATASHSPSQPRDIAVSHSRSRSATDEFTDPLAAQKPVDIMGNESSKPKQPPSRSSSRRGKSSPNPVPANEPSPPLPKREPAVVDGDVDGGAADLAAIERVTSVPDAYGPPTTTFSRPPRLPLAIEDEVHTPGSPILSPIIPIPAGTDTPDLEPLDQDIKRRESVVSSNVDEEDDPDEYQGYMVDAGPNIPKVPVVIEWRDAKPDDKVYVTGTFTNWEKKYRLHANGPSKHANSLSATLQLPPGTHHLKFLVNNEMTVATHLPTTVDYANYLVNYIEVTQSATAPVAVPSPIPSKPMDIRTKQTADTASPLRTTSPATKAGGTTMSPPSTPARSSPRPAKTGPPLSKPAHAKKYTQEIPQYLIDCDTWPPPTDSPDSSPEAAANGSKFHRANAATMSLPPPPTLPQFLNKSILNSTTPLKDDASVLILPNHTVLNHLATTNIKQGVLATSATTRYKKRFLTTIMYKPRSEDGD